MISDKYGEEEGGWWSSEARGGNGISHWKFIRNEWYTFFRRFSFKVGNGKRVKFWIDKWCGDKPLYVSFPSLFASYVAKKA